MVWRSVFIAFAAILAISSAAKRNFKTCKSHEDPSFSGCLEEAANIYFANLDEELEGIHHAFKPVKVSISNGPFSANMDYNITKFINSTKSVDVTLKYDANSKILSGGLKAPHVGYDTTFDMHGKLANVKLVGIGVGRFHVYDMDASFETHLHIKPSNDKLFEMDELKFKINKIRNAKIEFLELKSPSKELDAALRAAVKAAPDLLYSLGKESWDNNLRLHYEDLTRELLAEMLDDGLVNK